MKKKKREITKKNVSVPVLFLYFKSYLYKTLIYSVLSYIKITFSRFLLCRFAALPPHSPLRTVRASFPAYSSDNSKFNSHKIKSAHPRLYRQLFPIKFPFGTYVSGCVSASASRSRHPKSSRMDWLHISPLHVV